MPDCRGCTRTAKRPELPQAPGFPSWHRDSPPHTATPEPTPRNPSRLLPRPQHALLHRLLFNHPSTVYCSSSPPHHGVLFIQRQRHRSLFIQNPPQRSLFIPEAA